MHVSLRVSLSVKLGEDHGGGHYLCFYSSVLEEASS